MTEYFYKNPIAAAWMAKNHGIKFTKGDSLKSAIEAININGYNMIHETGYFYIKNIDVLDPQETDVVTLSNGAYHSTVGVKIGIEKAKKHISEGGRIIERNGVAFIWPEKSQTRESVGEKV